MPLRLCPRTPTTTLCTMSLHAMGDTAYLITFEGAMNAAMLARVRALAARLEADRPAGVIEIVSAYASVAVIYEPERVAIQPDELPWHAIIEWIERHLAGKGASARPKAPRDHVIPVCYGGEYGPDLESVAKVVKLTPEALIKLHAGATYTVAAIGFTPGFPYLLGLPEALAVPRRGTPRVRVPAGSVGIGGAQTGIYPRETPGGWQLIGRTGFELFDPLAEVPARLAPGDRVKFNAVDKLTPSRALPAGRASGRGTVPAGVGSIEVLRPGTLTTVQDLGRRGAAGQGIGVGGALDRWAAMAANLAIGNPPEAALLECTYVGPVLRFSAATTVAVLGAESPLLPAGRPLAIEAGAVLDCSLLTRGARLYLAVAGGLRVPLRLGAAATHLNAGFGGHEGRALVEGDRVVYDAKAKGLAAASWRIAAPVPPPAKKELIEVRLIPGPDWARLMRRSKADSSERAIEEMRFQLSAKSDRMGLRLGGDGFAVSSDAGEEVSRPVVPGTVQIPPDGHPIVLMAEGQTIGGYPQLGQIASIDLPKLAQARPGAEIVFRVSSVSAAQHARLRVADDLTRLRIGLQMRR